MKKSILYFVAAVASAAHAVTTTLEYEDLREAESRASVSNEIFRAASSATNYTDAVASSLRESVSVAASSATNYTDSVAASLGALAWVDSVSWADILSKPSWIGATKPSYSWSEISSKPSWIGATKPSYSWSEISSKPSWIGDTKPTLNDVCPETENWLGVPGTTAAGKSIKVLAKTVNGVIEGGMTVTGSSNNDSNTTKYRFDGVTVTRSGTATDYLFDSSSQSGIVRRSELADVTPGDYATVSNKAMTALQSYTETDPNVPSWAKASSKPSYSASEVGAAPSSLTSAVSSLSNNVVTVSNLIAAVAHEWSATNTTAVIACHTGKETVSIPSGGNLVANLSGWNDGVQTFVVLQPSGAYTVASNVQYCGYGNWPTNTALCVAWPYAGTLYVNPIIIIRE